MESLVVGARVQVASLMQFGHLEAHDGRRIKVLLEDGEHYEFAADSGQVVLAPFKLGDRVALANGEEGVVLQRAIVDEAVSVHVQWFNGSQTRVEERHLRFAEINDPVGRFQANRLDSADDFNLRSVAADLWIHHHSERFVSLSHAKFDLMPHQVGVLHRVMAQSPHRFLLCDEVGLGKTIEAAMVVKELRARGLAERILILCPANLQRQWQYELKTKFRETFSIFTRSTLRHLRDQMPGNPWTSRDANSVIASHAFASLSEARRDQIAAAPWDLVIVDEAHHARRRRNGNRVEQTNLYRLVRDLAANVGAERRAVLFLTATPMQLQYHELFSLVELLNHTLFPSEEDFRDHIGTRSDLVRLISEIESGQASNGPLQEYVSRAAAWLHSGIERELKLDSVEDLLRNLRGAHKLNEVMLRNRRASIGGFMPRTAKIWDVELSPRERQAQERMEQIISDGYRAAATASGRGANAIGFLMTIYQKLAASSNRALLTSLEGRRHRLIERELDTSDTETLDPDEASDQLDEDARSSDVTAHIVPAVADEADRIGEVIDLLRLLDVDSKAQALIANMRQIYYQESNPKVLIFTEFRETQEMLREVLSEEGWQCELFHGQLTPYEKDNAVIRIRDANDPCVLISTEAGGEGRNLQFANILINYDLPWNPMKVEQRIGRIDRIGQEREMLIFNFRVKGTIEERILEVLHDRIGMFENAIGGLEPILGSAEDDIRLAMREAVDKRETALQRVGEQLERKIAQARQADEELKHLYFDASEYQDEIKRLIGKAEAEQAQPRFAQRTVDSLLERLLRSINASVTSPGNGTRFPLGQRRVEFHPPFSVNERGLLDGSHQRHVCFDPTLPVASSDVEYFGFGHPIVNALIRRATEDVDIGKAAVRHLSSQQIPNLRPGWQFNWRFRLRDSAEGREWLMPFFVDDQLKVDEQLAERLLASSQYFADEDQPRNSARSESGDGLETACRLAEEFAVRFARDQEAVRKSRADETYETARARIERLYEIRLDGAHQRLQSSQATLQRIRESTDSTQRQVIPIWDFNVRKSKSTIAHLQEERQRELNELNESREPSVEFHLLNVARIEVWG